MSRPFAVFDIDGTIIRWQLYHALGDALARAGHIDTDAFQRVRDTRMDWKRRTYEDSFQDYETELVKVFDEALKNISVADFMSAAETVFAEYKDQVYTYTRDLISDLQAKNYLLFAISGSPDMIVKKLAEYYGFNDFAASIYPTAKGRFTGAKELSIGKKPQLLERLVGKHGASLKNSIAVGDSEGDITMLETVERPIAFNPSKKLYNHALKQGWEIVVERKNVVYKLGPENSKYVLKN